MFRKYLLPLAALAMLGFAVVFVAGGAPAEPKVSPPIAPAAKPFAKTVAGAGIVEAQTENISIGSALPGIVTEVHCKVGQNVKAGDSLFRLDDRQLVAEMKARSASLASAEAQLYKLVSMPRPEEVPSSEAKVREMRANLTDMEDQMNRARKLYQQRAMADEDMNRRTQAFRMAREQLVKAEADLALVKAGAWEPDKAVARASVEQARSQVEQTRTDIERLTVRALVDGEVLQVNVRPGEFVGAPAGQALVVLGSVKRMHVRVDVDEHDIPRFQPGAIARAALRGDPNRTFALGFVRVEPYVVPKKSLTGDNTERVDTRVLQVIYEVHTEPGQRLYVGQQLDVFIDAAAEHRE
jgi:multidrug resistance efflux pump